MQSRFFELGKNGGPSAFIDISCLAVGWNKLFLFSESY